MARAVAATASAAGFVSRLARQGARSQLGCISKLLQGSSHAPEHAARPDAWPLLAAPPFRLRLASPPSSSPPSSAPPSARAPRARGQRLAAKVKVA